MRDVQLSSLVNMDDPFSVMQEVRTIIHMIDPDHDLSTVDRVFKDIMDLFAGKYPGYKACNCVYHDFKHTTDTLLAMARLVHGAVLRSWRFSKKELDSSILSALLHDTGYIQEEWDNEGTGAKYTLIHVDRSIEFSNSYLKKIGFSDADTSFMASVLRCTGVRVMIHKVKFFSRKHELIGKMLGTADLMGQMADRTYLEKLPHLYREFREGNVPGYKDEFDLIRKTLDFYKWTLNRFETEFDSVYKFAKDHFKRRWGIGENLYLIAIEKNIRYLEHVINNYPHDYKRHLRRYVSSTLQNRAGELELKSFQ